MAIITRPAGGTSLTVKEADGTPSVSGVSSVTVSNGTLTNNTGGSVSLATGASGGGGGTSFNSLIRPVQGPQTFNDNTASAGQCMGVLFTVQATGTTKGIIFEPGASVTGNVRAAIYGPTTSPQVLTGAPLLCQSASVSAGVARTPLQVTLPDTAITPGEYYAMLQFSGASHFAQDTTEILSPPLLMQYFTQAYGAFPGTAPAASSDQGGFPQMVINMTTP